MSVIIRLQNLPWSANAHDIREFFKGLSIPEGGVHIVGGELGDAFIAFSSDEDARLAMQKSGTSLKGIQITLLLSSRTEMQKVIEAARQQALGMQSFMAPVAPAPAPPPPPPPPVQSIAPTQLQSQPSIHPQFQGSGPIQNHSQRVASEDQPLQNNQNQNIYSGRLPQPNQPSQSFVHPYNPQHSQYVPSPIPYPGQKVPGFPQGVVPPPPPPGAAMPSHYMYGQNPPVVSLPSTPVIPHHVPTIENTTAPTVSANFTAVEHQQTYNDPPHSTPKQQQQQQQPSQKEEEREKEKKSSALSSSTSTSSREKRERDNNKGRDDRRRRSKSRSRSKDRDRRRRHRSRSRSRDKSGRRKRSRSRERERTRERDRQRDHRRDNRDSSRSHREKSERSSHETSLEPKASSSISENETGIPGLGDIPDDIPKEGLSIFTQPSSTNPLRTKESPSSNSIWIKASNVTEPKSIKPSNVASETPQQKPFLLANPPIPNPFGNNNNNNNNNAPGALLADPKLMKNSPVPPRPYTSPPIDGVFKEPSQEWAQEDSNFRDNDRSNFRDDDRMYRSPNSNKNTNIDHSNRSWEESWDRGDLERDGAFSHRPFPHREDLGYNHHRDNDVADPHSQGGRGMYPERRDNIYTTRSFAGGFQSDFNKDFEDNFGRGGGGYRGRGRRGGGGFGRDNDRNSETAAHLEYEEPPFRDMHPQDFDRNRSGRGFFRGRGGRIPPNSERRSRTCSVEIRNVPANASHLIIRDLFNGIFVPNGSIKIIGGERGERIGVALVQFSNTWDAFEAYKRSGSYILNSRVQIKFIDDAIYEVARDIMYGNREGDHSAEPMEVTSPCVYVNGLPVGCTDHDVAKLFEDFKFEDIVLELEKGSRQPSGGCFVRFVSPEEAENALSEMKHPNIDGNPVKVGICTIEAMEEAAKERQKIKTRPPPQPQIQPEPFRQSEIGTKEHIMAITNNLKNSENGSSSNKNGKDEKSESKHKNENAAHTKGGDLLTDSIVIKNVSSDVNETNIRDFFSDEGLIPEKVYFNKPDSEGKSDVFVVFPKISDAKHSIKKNSQLLGFTKVSVELVSKPSVMLAMGLPFDPRELFLKGHEEQKDPSDISEKYEENISNDDYQTKERFPPRKMSPSQYDNHIRGGGGGGFNPRYNRSDEPYQGNYRPRQPFKYRRDHDNHPSERGNFEDRLSNKNIEAPRISEPPQDFGKPGCVVALANIPYAATTENILHFFKDFDCLQPENVIRRYDEMNRPTADSRVSLHSAEDAVKAVETLNHKLMLGRPIYVKLVN